MESRWRGRTARRYSRRLRAAPSHGADCASWLRPAIRAARWPLPATKPSVDRSPSTPSRVTDDTRETAEESASFIWDKTLAHALENGWQKQPDQRKTRQ